MSEVSPDGSAVRTELLQDGTFDRDPSSWRWIGTHRHSQIIDDPLAPGSGNRVLRLVATGAAGHMHNHLETTLTTSVQNGRTYQISYRACWVQGSNQLNTRLYFDRVARTTEIPMSSAILGTPGLPNAAQANSPSPHVFDVRHSPLVPQPHDPVVISAAVQAASPGLQLACHLEVSIGGETLSDVPMMPAADGRFEASVPAQPDGTVISFRLVASTSAGSTTTFPEREILAPSALYRVGPSVGASEAKPSVHVILTEETNRWFLAPENRMSNDHVAGTVIFGSEVFYNVGVRGKGSERGRVTDERLGFALYFDPTQPLLGAYHSAMLDRSEGQRTGQREWLLNQAMARAGSVSTEYNDLVHVVAPQPEHSGSAELQLARFGNTMLDRQFENGGDGQLYEFELIYYPRTTKQGTGTLPPPPPRSSSRRRRGGRGGGGPDGASE